MTPRDASYIINDIIYLINQSDKVTFFVFSLTYSEIIEALVFKASQDPNFQIVLYSNEKNSPKFWKTYKKFKEQYYINKHDSKFLHIILLLYSPRVTQIHLKRVFFHKNNQIIAATNGTVNYTYNGINHSIDSVKLTTYDEADQDKVQKEYNYLEKICSKIYSIHNANDSYFNKKLSQSKKK